MNDKIWLTCAMQVLAEPDTIHAPLLHVMHASIETSFPCTPSQLAFVYMFANDAASPQTRVGC